MPDEKHDVPPISGSGASPLSQPAHTLPYEVVIKELGTGLDEGLSPEEASRRLQEYGPNKLDEGEGVSVIKILVRQVANAMMLVRPPLSILRVDITKVSQAQSNTVGDRC
jgi:magnesium-transporting ATPase (P-type)